MAQMKLTNFREKSPNSSLSTPRLSWDDSKKDFLLQVPMEGNLYVFSLTKEEFERIRTAVYNGLGLDFTIREIGNSSPHLVVDPRTTQEVIEDVWSVINDHSVPVRPDTYHCIIKGL